MNIVNNEKELLKAVNDNVSEIVLEGEWKNNIAEIFTKDSVSWLVAVSSITSIVTMSVAQSISELLDLSIAAPVVGMFGIGIATYLVEYTKNTDWRAAINAYCKKHHITYYNPTIK